MMSCLSILLSGCLKTLGRRQSLSTKRFVQLSSISNSKYKDSDVVSKRRNLRFMFPEFLPDPETSFRNKVSERLARRDMIKRRENVELPEFYVGSIIAITSANPYATPKDDKLTRFVGIVIDRGGAGLRAWIIVRNHIDGEGIELMYDLYSPMIQKIEVIKLEERLDDELYYLRDADPKYSTIPFDMDVIILPEGTPVPMNEEIVPLNPRPWTRRWDRYLNRLKGFSLTSIDDQTEARIEKFNAKLNPGWQMEYYKYDLLRMYKHTVPFEEQDAIWAEVGEALERRDVDMRKVAAQKAFIRPVKTG